MVTAASSVNHSGPVPQDHRLNAYFIIAIQVDEQCFETFEDDFSMLLVRISKDCYGEEYIEF